MSGLGAIAAIASLAGTAVSVAGTIATGQAQARAAEYEAKQYEINAKEERAAAQHQAMDLQHQARLAVSRGQAVAAASGFGAGDTTVANQLGEIGRYGSLQSQMAQYGGDSRAAGLNSQAQARRLSGQAALTGSYYSG